MSEITPGQPIWTELVTTDGAKAEAFYGQLFGWTFNEGAPEFGGYRIITQRDGAVVGGSMVKDVERMGDIPDAFAVYLATDDIQATDQKIRAAGGTVMLEPMQVMDQGWMAFGQDPTGAAVGSWQGNLMRGSESGEKVGLPVWFELLTRDHDAAVAFYRDAYDWQPEAMGEGYTLNAPYERSQAGICDASDSPFLPEGVPAHWQIYFHVADSDAAAAQVEQLGGKILIAPADSPHGRNVTCVDDQGALFLMSGPNKEAEAVQA